MKTETRIRQATSAEIRAYARRAKPVVDDIVRLVIQEIEEEELEARR